MVDDKEVLKAFASRLTDKVIDLNAEGKSNDYINGWASGYVEGAKYLAEEITRMIISVTEDPVESSSVFVKALKGLSN